MGLQLAGWVASQVDPQMSCFEENLQTLKEALPAPCLRVIPWLEGEDKEVAAADYLELSGL